MHKLLSIPFAFVALFATTMNVQAVDTFEDTETHVSFPKEISIDHEGKSHQLQATGVATRSKFIVKVYSIAHYMDQPPSGTPDAIFKEILTDNRAKQLTEQWTYAIDINKLQEGFRESFSKILTEEQRQAIQKEIDQFIGFYDKNVAVKDQHVIRWLPGGTIELQINGEKKGSLTNPAFAEALWSIWLGPKSVVNRNRLISLIVQK